LLKTLIESRLMKQAHFLSIAMASLAAAYALPSQAQDCSALASSAPAGVTLKAEVMPQSAATPAAGNAPALPALNSHCKLTGQMRERVGVSEKGTPRQFHISFELRLPSDWNGRLLYQGGGGNDGVVRPALGPQATGDVLALNRGFAVVTTDAGHQGPWADFGWDPMARVDNAYHAHDLVAQTAKNLVQRYYAKPADKAYFIGCSGGGRQAMMFTQRFPQHFDGVIAIAPAMRVSKGATIAAMWDSQALMSIAPQNDKGERILSQALTDSDLGLLRQGILKQCDAADGVVDGLVSRPAACQFEVKSLQCKAGKDASCLSEPQVKALQKMFAGPKNSKGESLYTGWAWDPGIGHPANDWRQWKLGSALGAVPNSRHIFLMQDALQGYFVTPPDRKLTALNFNFDTDPARMDAHSWMFDTAADTELSGFKARGGKLILAHGMADPIFSPLESEAYFKQLQASKGGQEMSRYFQIPGMSHCQGGAATDSWDGLSAMVNWVEKGQAPEWIVAKGTQVFPARTRPLCAYPKTAQYKGTGSVEDAASFSCQ
jgi:pimeloyl-ACP methyl ester carboxylesterase